MQEQTETTHYLCTPSLGFEHCGKYSAYGCEFNVRLKTCQACLDPPYWLVLSQFWLLAVKNILLSDTQNLVLASEIHKHLLPKSPFWLGKIMCRCLFILPSGKHTKNYGKPPFVMVKITISMAIFNSYFERDKSVASPWLFPNFGPPAVGR